MAGGWEAKSGRAVRRVPDPPRNLRVVRFKKAQMENGGNLFCDEGGG